jgi:hypothetical protein
VASDDAIAARCVDGPRTASIIDFVFFGCTNYGLTFLITIFIGFLIKNNRLQVVLNFNRTTVICKTANEVGAFP